MEHLLMKCARRHLQWLSCLVCASAALLLFVLSAPAQTAILESIGGGGGSQFIARCAESELLAGFELRAGDDIDAIRPMCVTAFGPRETTPALLTRGSGLITIVKSQLGKNFDLVKLESGWYGGTGGDLTNVICPSSQPVVIGMYVRAEGLRTITVNNIHLFCGLAATTQTPSDLPSAIFDAPAARRRSNGILLDDEVLSTEGAQQCPAGLVAVGVHGKSGVWVDSMGLICGPPKLIPRAEPVKAVGRTKTGAPPGPPRSICEVAREARARNSPAAPGLEAQCRAAGAAGETPPVKAIGRVRASPPTDAPPRLICDVAQEARARNSPAAPGLEERCRADLAAKGAAIAEQDAIVAEARAAETDGLYREGFDIATGIFGDPALGAQGNTATGPGSLRIRDSLSDAGQRGFNASVTLHLSRNYKP